MVRTLALACAARCIRIDRTARAVIVGHAFVQNLRRGHYEIGLDAPPALRLSEAFTELARASDLPRSMLFRPQIVRNGAA
jgi:hypothetical protein